RSGAAGDAAVRAGGGGRRGPRPLPHARGEGPAGLSSMGTARPAWLRARLLAVEDGAPAGPDPALRDPGTVERRRSATRARNAGGGGDHRGGRAHLATVARPGGGVGRVRHRDLAGERAG